MLRWSIFLFIVALVAASLGFAGIADAPAKAARLLCVLLLTGFALTSVASIFEGRRRRLTQ